MIANVVGIGARAPLGLSALQVALGVRARKKEPRAIDQLDRFGHEMAVCFVGGMAASLHGDHRLAALAAPALTEALAQARDNVEVRPDYPLPLVLALPAEGRPDDHESFARVVMEGMESRSGIALDRQRSKVVRRDHAGFAHALTVAQELFAEGLPLVAVGGVDSYFHPQVLDWLDGDFRLASLRAEQGFLPSEAAAFVVFGNAKSSLAKLTAIDTATEPSDLDDELPNLAEALTAMLAASEARMGCPDWVINDCNGERHRRLEFDLGAVRRLKWQTTISSWADDLGDCGAATGALYSAIAIQLWQLSAATADHVVITLASEAGERGLVSWQSPTAEKREPKQAEAQA